MVGAGIVGLSCAWSLQEYGVEVRVVDRMHPGSGASWQNAGFVSPAGAIVAPGVARYDAPGETWLGPFEPQPATMPEVELLARLLTEGGLPTQAMADARGPRSVALPGMPSGRGCASTGATSDQSRPAIAEDFLKASCSRASFGSA